MFLDIAKCLLSGTSDPVRTPGLVVQDREVLTNGPGVGAGSRQGGYCTQ